MPNQMTFKEENTQDDITRTILSHERADYEQEVI